MKSKEKVIRKPNKFEAFSCIVVMLLVLIVFTRNKVDISVALLTTTLYMVIIGLRCGYTLRQLLDAMLKKVASIADLSVLLCGIGFLVAALVFGGTIPTLITYLMKFITPSMCIPLGFVLTALTAFFIGTSYGTAGTMGIIMITLGTALGVNLPLLAGAVIGGSHVGLFISPMSDNFNTTAALAKADTAATLKRALYIAVPALIICIVFYTVMGFAGGISGTAVDTTSLSRALAEIFNISPIALIPIIYVFIVSFKKLPAILALYSGGFIAIIIGALLNGFSVWDGLACTVNGFDVTAISGMSAEAIIPQVMTLCNRGGMVGMAELFVIIYAAMNMAGVMTEIGVLEVVIETLMRNVKTVFGLAVWNWIIGFLASICTSSSAVAIIMPFEMLEQKYEDLGYSKLDCAVLSNTLASPIMSITPWSDVGIYMSGVVGVSVLSYAPYSLWSWGLGLVAVACSVFKFGYKKNAKTEEDVAAKA